MTDRETYQKLVHCYAEGRPGTWEAYCIELDLAVQGRSLEEVRGKLHDQISLYLESVMALPENERARLLNRPMPISTQIRMMLKLIGAMLSRSNNRKQRAIYDCPLDGAAMAA